MKDVDVLIIGGGLVGSSFASAVASHPLAAGLSVMIVDPSAPDVSEWPPLSLRTSTITLSSKAFLEDIGVWSHVPTSKIASFDKMFVWDHPAPLPLATPAQDLSKLPAGTILFDADDVGESALGYVVDNDTLRNAMYRHMQGLGGDGGSDLRFAHGTVSAIDFGDNGVSGTAHGAMPSAATGGGDAVPWPIVELDDGSKIRSRLLVACDGSRSRVRTLAGADWFSHRYRQTAVVANVAVGAELGTAFQRFVDTGPVAVLPVRTGQGEEHVGNVIWTTTPAEAQALLTADNAEFLNELNVVLNAHEDVEAHEGGGASEGTESADNAERLWGVVAKGLQIALPRLGLGDGLPPATGLPKPPYCRSVLGPRASFPLTLGHAPRYVLEERRTVLLGDAAHSVHPLAGQGVNLGFADAKSLADSVAGAAAVGRDVGGEGGAGLMQFQRERVVGNLGMMGLLHGLQRGFGAGGPWGRGLRRVGISAVQAALPLKRMMVRAMR